MTIAPEKDLSSTGKVSALLQASPNEIERAAAKANIAPVLRLNGITYYSDEQISKIRRHLRSGKR